MIFFNKNMLFFILFLIIYYNQLISGTNLEKKNKIFANYKQFIDKAKCMTNCINGNCNENECVCLPNYSGHNCNATCPIIGSFGTECEFNCYDLLENKKDTCKCFRGKYLFTKSKNECDLKCNCLFNECGPGFMGKKCLPCKDNYYGINCLDKCKCKTENTLECDKRNGDCKCKPSFFGIWCEDTCDLNSILYCDTMQRCKCINNSRKSNESNQLNEFNVYNESEIEIIPDYTIIVPILLILIIIGLVIYILKINKNKTVNSEESNSINSSNKIKNCLFYLPNKSIKIYSNIFRRRNPIIEVYGLDIDWEPQCDAKTEKLDSKIDDKNLNCSIDSLDSNNSHNLK